MYTEYIWNIASLNWFTDFRKLFLEQERAISDLGDTENYIWEGILINLIF